MVPRDVSPCRTRTDKTMRRNLTKYHAFKSYRLIVARSGIVMHRRNELVCLLVPNRLMLSPIPKAIVLTPCSDWLIQRLNHPIIAYGQTVQRTGGQQSQETRHPSQRLVNRSILTTSTISFFPSFSLRMNGSGGRPHRATTWKLLLHRGSNHFLPFLRKTETLTERQGLRHIEMHADRHVEESLKPNHMHIAEIPLQFVYGQWRHHDHFKVCRYKLSTPKMIKYKYQVSSIPTRSNSVLVNTTMFVILTSYRPLCMSSIYR